MVGAVGQPNAVVEAVELEDGKHESEDFFLGQGHVGTHVGEDRGFDVVAATVLAYLIASGQCVGPVGLGGGDVAEHGSRGWAPAGARPRDPLSSLT